VEFQSLNGLSLALTVERLASEPHTRLRYFCSPHHADSALYPSITQLERAAGFRREDTAEHPPDRQAPAGARQRVFRGLSQCFSLLDQQACDNEDRIRQIMEWDFR
jgi:hypothetical protein